jgi:trehalose/maltose hydrolase-like predicted phosphorylase
MSVETTFEAIIADWEGTAVLDRRADVDALRKLVEGLCAAGVHIFLVSRTDVARVDGQLRTRPVGPGTLHLCLNGGSEVFEVNRTGPSCVWRRSPTHLGPTDKGDSTCWAANWLAQRGITGGLILVVGSEFGSPGDVSCSETLMLVPALARARVVSVGAEPGNLPAGVVHVGGGSDGFAALLREQSRRRGDRRVPWIDDDPAWTVPLPGSKTMERAAEAIGTLSNGSAGLRAAREEGGAPGIPAFLVQGVYGGVDPPGLLPGPWWAGVRLHGSPDRDRRVLDLRTAVLARSVSNDALRSIRFVSAATPRTMAQRAEGAASDLQGVDELAAPATGLGFENCRRDGVRLARTSDGSTAAAIAVASCDRERTVGPHRMVERVAAWSGTSHDGALDAAAEQLAAAEVIGFDRLLAVHREEWARRWSNAEVTIVGDDEDQLASRFAVFHLLSAAPETGEAAVSARGLTGPAYGGHVFWDADVFVLPALAALQPGSARAMLEYRLRRLPAARAAASDHGCRGARFPWESAEDGSDVTPRLVRDSAGRVIPIRTGQHEEHIVADVAWSAAQYAAWTGDGFLTGAGRDLVIDCARYWASRARHDPDGRAHIYGVMGPDEYHEVVDDNAFTNVMARWNLRFGAELLRSTGGDLDEADAWRDVAEALVDGFDTARGLYEQFAGYWGLEPLLIGQVASPPVAADMILGRERVAGSQLIKQADVLMLHHLVPDEVVSGSLASNFAFYEPRTAHGSSLSPAVHASLLARAGQADRALELFRLASRLDLDDLTGTTAGGLHLATMGGVWQALAFGFLGLRASGSVLDVDPCLPRAWKALGLRFCFRGAAIGVRAEHGELTVRCDAPIAVRVGFGPVRTVQPPGATIATRKDGP